MVSAEKIRRLEHSRRQMLAALLAADGPRTAAYEQLLALCGAVADLSEISQTGDMTVNVRIRVDGFPNTGAIGTYQIAISVSRGG